MACATLKRSYDFDPLVSPSQLQRSPKRRRCGPSIVTSPVQPASPAKSSPFVERTPKFSSGKLKRMLFIVIERVFCWFFAAGNDLSFQAKPRALCIGHARPNIIRELSTNKEKCNCL